MTGTLDPQSRSEANGREPIAIVGIGCRVPKASGPAAFWELLAGGVDAISEIPQDRLPVDGLYDPTPATPGRIMTKWGGFVDGIDRLDAGFFGIAPRAATFLDPQQRLLLEVSWEALEDAGIPADAIRDTDSGVFVGLWLNEYESRMTTNPAAIEFYMTLGTGRYAASGRLSYFLGLRGPSVTYDTACSSSLVAIHQACRSIWSGDCRMALAGGANVIVEPFITIAYSQSRMMAPDGRCKFGDARGDGYVRSDGAGMIVLKPLADAVASNDRIYAVIRGGAVNNDGRSSGSLGTPARAGQEDLLRKAYRDAGVSPGDVQYVEAHGTGTLAGDPVEIGALGAVLSEGRPADRRCYVGSVKTNIGHTEGAAGVSGVIKAALALHHGVIPKSLHFNEPNPAIPWAELPVQIAADPVALSAGAVAGVSAFGIAGTNAHMVLAAAPAQEPRPDPPRRQAVLTLSAKSEAGLGDVVRAFIARLEGETAFGDVCFTAATRRTHLDHRVAVAAAGADAAIEQLQAFLDGERRPGLSSGQVTTAPGKVAFVFPGQGSQWLGMGRQLFAAEPVFRTTLERVDTVVHAFTGWSVTEELHAPEDRSNLARIDVVQPTLFAIQVALAALWRSWGIEPAAVVGHSMGEVAAAHVAGALSVEDAARIICRRSVLLRRTSGRGAMAVVELSLAEAEQALRGFEDRLAVAVSNSSKSTVLSGDPAALDEVLAGLEARGVFCRKVKVDVASHSPQMDPLRDELIAAIRETSPAAAALRFCSTVAGREIDGTQLTPDYWSRNLREPVLFSKAVRSLVENGFDTFIEMSPHPLLVAAVQEVAGEAGRGVLSLGSGRREEDESAVIRASLGALHCAGVPVAWQSLFSGDCRLVDLPNYPWQRDRFWYDATSATSSSADQIGPAVTPALAPESRIWQFPIESSSLMAWLVAMGHAVRQVHGNAAVGLQDVRLETVPTADATQLVAQLVLDSCEPGAGLSGYLRWAGQPVWRRVVRATVMEAPDTAPSPVEPQALLADLEGPAAAVLPDAGRIVAHAAGSLLLCDVGRAGVSARLDPWTVLIEAADRNSAPATTGRHLVAVTNARWLRDPLTARFAMFRGADAHLRCFDSHGRPVGELSGLQMQATAPAAAEDLSWQVLWQAISPESLPVARVDGSRRWFVVPDGPARSVAAATLASHLSATLVDSSARIDDVSSRLAGLRAGDGAGVVFVCDTVDFETTTAAVLSERLTQQGLAIVDLARALSASPARNKQLLLVTQGAHVVGGKEPAVGSAGQFAWGLGSVVAVEHPELGCVRIDLSASPDDLELSSVAGLADSLQGGELIAFRQAEMFAGRLVNAMPAAAPSSTRPRSVAASASTKSAALITGGYGALGLLTAEWLAERGTRHLLLAGRSSPGPDASRRIRQLADAGVQVIAETGDAAEEQDVERWLATLRANRLAPTTVVHTAGVLHDRLLADLSAEDFGTVLRGKVVGAWQLHRLTSNLPVERFVLFSSVMSFLGGAGQGNYAAANACLDGLATHRRSLGHHALSVQWGPWESVGLAAQRADRGGRLAARGLGGLTADEAFHALAAVFDTPAPATAIMRFSPHEWTQSFQGAASMPLFNSVLQPAPGADDAVVTLSLRDQLVNADSAARVALLENALTEALARVLKQPVAKIVPDAPLRSLGLDSLMALEFRNRIEAGLEMSVPVTAIWNHPTVARLAIEILRRAELLTVPPTAVTPAAVDRPATDELEALLDEIESLTDAETRGLLGEGR